MKRIKCAVMYCANLVILCAGTASIEALAQEKTNVDALSLEEVIVTAQKREQNVQDVPIAISAFDENFLIESGVNDITELQAFVPGLSIYSEYSNVVPSFNIRGLGTTATNVALESSVGIYVDGVYRARQASGINDLVDVERVEVIKGPQGTLFGKNTVAGAVQFLTVAPVLDEWDGFAEFSAGSENLGKFKGAVNIPLLDGRAAARFSAGITKRDGYVENIITGDELNEKDRFSLRGQLLFEVTESLSARLIVDHSELDELCCGGSNIFDGPTETVAGFNPAAGFVLPVETVAGRSPVLAADFDRRQVAYSETPSADVEESGVSVELKWGLKNATFTSLTAYRTYEAIDVVSDWMPVDFIEFLTDTEQDTFTQEFRLDGIWGDKLTYSAGLYYFDQELDDLTSLIWGQDGNTLLTGGATLGLLDSFGALGLPAGAVCGGAAVLGPEVEALCPLPFFPPGEGAADISEQTQTSWAIFGQFDYKFTDNLIATVGLRFLDEEKEIDLTFVETVPAPSFAAITLFSPAIPDLQGVKISDTAVTGTAKLSYFWNDDVMTYISYGRGYKSGGTNTDRVPAGTGAQQTFDPESSDAYEIGLKGDFLDSRVRINAAAFYSKLDDFQANNFVGSTFVLQNAGALETKGVEFDILALPLPWLRVSSGFAYVDAVYDDFQTGACAITPFGMSPDAGQAGFPNSCDVTGDQIGGTPEWSAYASIRTEHNLNDGLVYVQYDMNWRDDAQSGIDSSGDPNLRGDSVTLANLRVGYRFGDKQQYDVSLWSTNLFDKNYQTVSFNSPFRPGSVTGIHTEPRLMGVTLRADF